MAGTGRGTMKKIKALQNTTTGGYSSGLDNSMCEKNDKGFWVTKVGKHPICTQKKTVDYKDIWCTHCKKLGHSRNFPECPNKPKQKGTVRKKGREYQVKRTQPKQNIANSLLAEINKEMGSDYTMVDVKLTMIPKTAKISDEFFDTIPRKNVSMQNERIQVPCTIGNVELDVNNLKASLEKHGDLPNEFMIAMDTGAGGSTLPEAAKNRLHSKEKLHNTYVAGVVGEKAKIDLKGKWTIPGTKQAEVDFHLTPGSKMGTLSISSLAKNLGASAWFNDEEAFVYTKDGLLIHGALDGSGLYLMSSKPPKDKMNSYIDIIKKSLIGLTTQIRNLDDEVLLNSIESTKAVLLQNGTESQEELLQFHLKENHESFDRIRKRHNYPPATLASPDPLCIQCTQAAPWRNKGTQESAEHPSRPGTHFTGDVSRLMPSNRKGWQRYMVVKDKFSDQWYPLFGQRKSDFPDKLMNFFKRMNNFYSPYKVVQFETDGESCLKSDKFTVRCEDMGIFNKWSPPGEQHKNPAEVVMKLVGKIQQAYMFKASLPPGSWHFSIMHTCHVHNHLDEPSTQMSPHQSGTGIKSRFKNIGVFGSLCTTKLYANGKAQRKAVECIYLGWDAHCNAAIVRPINSTLASNLERYGCVVKHSEPAFFPYTLPTVPRPKLYGRTYYESDSDEEARNPRIEGIPRPVQQERIQPGGHVPIEDEKVVANQDDVIPDNFDEDVIPEPHHEEKDEKSSGDLPSDTAEVGSNQTEKKTIVPSDTIAEQSTIAIERKQETVNSNLDEKHNEVNSEELGDPHAGDLEPAVTDSKEGSNEVKSEMNPYSNEPMIQRVMDEISDEDLDFMEDELGVSYDELKGNDLYSSFSPPAGSGGLAEPIRRSTRSKTMSDAAVRAVKDTCAIWLESQYEFDEITQSYQVMMAPLETILPILKSQLLKHKKPTANNQPSFTGGVPLKQFLGIGAKITWKDPTSLQQVMQHERKEYYLEAMMKERMAWMARNVLKPVLRSEVPDECVVMKTKSIWTSKPNAKDNTLLKDKYRITLDGSVIESDKQFTYDGTVSIVYLRVLFTLLVRFKGFKFATSDMSTFFLGSELREGEEYYMEWPEGWTELDRRIWVARLMKAAYGLPTASQTAGLKLTAALESLGFVKLINDPKAYIRYRGDDDIILTGYHVDDGGFIYNNKDSMIEVFEDFKKKGYECTIEWNPSCYRGIEIVQIPNGIKIHMNGFLEKLAADYKVDTSKPPLSPCPDKVCVFERRDQHSDTQASPHKVKEYMTMQGNLQWAVLCYPSCSFTVNHCARFMCNPQERHFELQKRCLAYMISISKLGVSYTQPGDGVKEIYKKGYAFDDLVLYPDASFAEDKESKSTTGNLLMTKNGPLIHETMSQTTVSTSTCECEICANKYSCMQTIWVKRLLIEMGFTFTKPTVCYQDNTSALALCKSDAHHKRSRHFRIACFFLRELFLNRTFSYVWCASKDMWADILTKALGRVLHLQQENVVTNTQEKREFKKRNG